MRLFFTPCRTPRLWINRLSRLPAKNYCIDLCHITFYIWTNSCGTKRVIDFSLMHHLIKTGKSGANTFHNCMHVIIGFGTMRVSRVSCCPREFKFQKDDCVLLKHASICMWSLITYTWSEKWICVVSAFSFHFDDTWIDHETTLLNIYEKFYWSAGINKPFMPLIWQDLMYKEKL